MKQYIAIQEYNDTTIAHNIIARNPVEAAQKYFDLLKDGYTDEVVYYGQELKSEKELRRKGLGLKGIYEVKGVMTSDFALNVLHGMYTKAVEEKEKKGCCLYNCKC